ncbi:MAG TPA: hypothetical protein VMR28_01685 [Candidatus Saccharimonadales bacterium]|nr:hypothetical protein [Candidatus Saccharimonadales bacterium]
MTPILYLALTVLVPIIVAVILRVNAAVLFMSLCVGEVLVLFVAGNADSFASAVSPTGNVGISTMRIGLLLLPPALTIIFMLHSINGSTKVAMNVIPAIGAGLLLALLLEPLLAPGIRAGIQHSALWHQFSSAQSLVVGLGALFSLMFLWLGRHSNGRGHHGHHSQRH